MDSVPRIPHAYELQHPGTFDPLNYIRSIIAKELSSVDVLQTKINIEFPIPYCFFNDPDHKEEDRASLLDICYAIKYELEELGYKEIKGHHEEPDFNERPWMKISFNWNDVVLPPPMIKGCE